MIQLFEAGVGRQDGGYFAWTRRLNMEIPSGVWLELPWNLGLKGDLRHWH